MIDSTDIYWTLVGAAGAILFGGRWVVQAVTSRARGISTVPQTFWYMSMAGNLLLLSYFIFGRTDAVGIVSNLLPLLVALYNIYLLRLDKKNADESNQNR